MNVYSCLTKHCYHFFNCCIYRLYEFAEPFILTLRASLCLCCVVLLFAMVIVYTNICVLSIGYMHKFQSMFLFIMHNYLCMVVSHYIEERRYKLAWKWKAYFLHYIEVVLLGTCGKIEKKHWFYGIFRRFGVFLLCVVGTGIDTDSKSWKEKVFVLRDYIYTYMFRLCSWMFGAAAIEKYCTLFELYQNSKTKIGSRKTE